MVSIPFAQSFDQLPSSLPIFPLSDAVVMPGSFLPLNIFEPRYLNMVRDAMKSEQLIGMIQPCGEKNAKSLHAVGTCGRIIQYEERYNGQMGIVLYGLCRFRVSQELDTIHGYRMVIPDWSCFSADFEKEPVDEDSFAHFRGLLKAYIDEQGYDPKWKAYVDTAESRELINNAVGEFALPPQDRQLLVEAPTLNDRLTVFIAAMQSPQESETRH